MTHPRGGRRSVLGRTFAIGAACREGRARTKVAHIAGSIRLLNRGHEGQRRLRRHMSVPLWLARGSQGVAAIASSAINYGLRRQRREQQQLFVERTALWTAHAI